MTTEKLTVKKRLTSATPKFFRVVRTIGLCFAAAGAALLTAPISLPITVATVAGYLTVAGGVMTAISQAAVQGE